MMFKIDCKTDFSGKDKVFEAAHRGGVKGLYRAAAFLMRCAQRKIKYRKHKSSAPGNPPFQHGQGKTSFRHLVQFAVDEKNAAAYIGPRKIYGKKGNDVPHVLEFGGMTSPAANPLWYQTEVPQNVKTQADIANWLLESQKYGPLFMAGSESGVVNQYFQGRGKYSRRKIAESKKTKPDQWIFQNIQKRNVKSEKGGKKSSRRVYYITVKIRSMAQAAKAAANIVKFFGLPVIKPRKIAPRPFMGPSLQESQNNLAKFFAKTLK